MRYITYKIEDDDIKTLMETDQKLKKLIGYIKKSELEIEEDGFKCLVKYIVGQQISDRQRELIWKNICANIKNIAPTTILNTNNELFRNLGIPSHKIHYIRNLAHLIVNREIDLRNLSQQENNKIINELIKIKGIGIWTAEMYLIFSLGRTDVLPKGDRTVKRAIQWMYNLDQLPNDKQLVEFFSLWQGKETIVATFLWESITLNLTDKPFDQLECEGDI